MAMVGGNQWHREEASGWNSTLHTLGDGSGYWAEIGASHVKAFGMDECAEK